MVVSNPVTDPAARESGSAADGFDEDFLDLHREREEVERALRLAQARQRFSTEPGDSERAVRDEAELLARLDRLMTRLRAVEYRRGPGARRW